MKNMKRLLMRVMASALTISSLAMSAACSSTQSSAPSDSQVDEIAMTAYNELADGYGLHDPFVPEHDDSGENMYYMSTVTNISDVSRVYDEDSLHSVAAKRPHHAWVCFENCTDKQVDEGKGRLAYDLERSLWNERGSLSNGIAWRVDGTTIDGDVKFYRDHDGVYVAKLQAYYDGDVSKIANTSFNGRLEKTTELIKSIKSHYAAVSAVEN